MQNNTANDVHNCRHFDDGSIYRQPTRSAPAGRSTLPGDRRSESTPPKKSRQNKVPATSGVGRNAERKAKKIDL